MTQKIIQIKTNCTDTCTLSPAIDNRTGILSSPALASVHSKYIVKILFLNVQAQELVDSATKYPRPILNQAAEIVYIEFLPLIVYIM